MEVIGGEMSVTTKEMKTKFLTKIRLSQFQLDFLTIHDH